MTRHTRIYLATTALLVFISTVLSACDSASLDAALPKDPFVTYEVAFDPGSFQGAVTNLYFPLQPGTVWHYEGQTAGGLETGVVEVLNETRRVAGVTGVVVRDRVYLDGNLIEDTFDWYAQDKKGNVWYLGEDAKAFRDGQVVSTAGSWEAGVGGALAGIIMPASPEVGQAYYQEIWEGIAEDRGRVLSVNETVTVGAGDFSNCVKTEDTTPLEPDVLEYKYYCGGSFFRLDYACLPSRVSHG